MSRDKCHVKMISSSIQHNRAFSLLIVPTILMYMISMLPLRQAFVLNHPSFLTKVLKSETILLQSSSFHNNQHRRQEQQQRIILHNQKKPDIIIEYCTGCRWMLRSAWMAQELLTTFRTEINSITLLPSRPPSPAGTFIISLNDGIVWDRKMDGGFPESKIVKQLIRDKIAPEKSLGHSDVKEEEENKVVKLAKEEDCVECKENEIIQDSLSNETDTTIENSFQTQPHVIVQYCSTSDWLLRSAWACQEILTNFPQDVKSVSLQPDHSGTKGTFMISIDSDIIWDVKTEISFPNVDQLIARVNEYFHPDNQQNDDIDDETAAEMRRFYGVL